MFCTNCGQKLADGAVYCVGCGVSTQQTQTQTQTRHQYATPAQEKRIVGFILSFFFALPALIVSIIEYRKAKEEGSSTTFALAGIIISSISMGLTLIFCIVFIPIYVGAIIAATNSIIPLLAPIALI